MRDISIIGSGYVGLVTAVGFADSGRKVICIDTDEDKVQQINEGKLPFYEAGLESRLALYVNGRNAIKASSDYNEILDTEVAFICVGTPCNSNGIIDLSYVRHSTTEIAKVLARGKNYHIVVVKSTVVPGTTEEIIIPILEKYSNKKIGSDFSVAVNPEFLQEGRAFQDFINPDKIIIGEYNHRAGDMLQRIYSHFNAPIIRTNIKTAEMIKYASNAFLATKISFANEIGNICKRLDIDVYDVTDAIGHDPRIGNTFLDAGIGFGGSCLPKDVNALIHRGRETGYQAVLLESILRINREQPLRLVEVVRQRLGDLKNKVIAVLGLAFKPKTDDIREASTLSVISQLLADGATVKVYDPLAMSNAKQIIPSYVIFCDSTLDAIADSDCIIITTEWDEFRDESLYAGKVVIDGRRALDPEKARQVCQHYEGVCW
jgi:UDPglucose 6-dehydrogenase